MTPRHDDWNDEEREALTSLAEEWRRLRIRHEDDPPLDLLRSAGARVLPDDLQAAAESYLKENPWSRTLVKGCAQEAALDPERQRLLLDRIRAGAHAGENRALFTIRRVAFALAALLVFACAVVFWRLDIQSRGGLRSYGSSGATESQRQASGSATPAEFVLALEMPPVKLTAAALVVRGAAKDNRLIDDLAPAFNAYRQGDYAHAETRFAALASRHPESTEVFFYLGVSRLYTSELPGAVQALETARRLGDVSFAPDVSWYLAVAYERMHRIDAARSELESLCRGFSDYAPRACKAAERF